MNISGTLHLYSGADRELFFVFDDDLAQTLYEEPAFSIRRLESRRVQVSVGRDRFIHQRTLSFSKKQSEIKVSLCSKATRDGLGSLTALYNWFSLRGRPRPAPFAVIGTLKRVRHDGSTVWELHITEPAELVVPPGLSRRKKALSKERRSFVNRRRILERDLAAIGRPAEALALAIAQHDHPEPRYKCLWRKGFLDSELLEIRKLGILADIDVWDTNRKSLSKFIEVKAQKVRHADAEPRFYLSVAEWRSYHAARKARIPYGIWVFQYRRIQDFKKAPKKVELVILTELHPDWLQPDGYLVVPTGATGHRFAIGS